MRVAEDEEPYAWTEPNSARLVPGVNLEDEDHTVRSGIGGASGPDGSFEMEGAARTQSIPQELNLHEVETIDIDQSHRAVILWIDFHFVL